MITPSVSLNEFLISILPGGTILSVVLATLIIRDPNIFKPFESLEVLSIFLFLSGSFIIAEMLQTIAHICEKIIDLLFFKGYRPSDIFLLPNNPIVNNELVRRDLLEKLNITKDQENSFVNYKEIPFKIYGNKKISYIDMNKKCFWKIYTQCRNEEHIKDSNARYLFTRVMFVVFVFLSIWFLKYSAGWLLFCSIAFALLFMWRVRGCARGLVFAIANKYLDF